MNANKKQIVITLSVVLVMAILGGIGIGFCVGGVSTTESDEYRLHEAKQSTPVGAEMRLLYAGTTFWGRHTNEMARASALDVKYPFSQLDSLEPSRYDAWIAGLECPVTDNGHNAYEEETLFEFNCDPDYLPEAAKYFTAFGLGNNHTDNQDGGAGLAKTREYLDKYGIQYFGTPKYSGAVSSEEWRDEAGKSNCGVLVLPVRVQMSDKSEDIYRLPFGFCSAHGVFGVPGNDYMENIQTYSVLMPTVAMPHMGVEYDAAHDTLRQNVFRRMIDLGADAVIADHPHWVQDTEVYGGKLIAYSIGNFMFDQLFEPDVRRSAAIEALATISVDGVDLDAWSRLGEQCLELHGECLELIREANLPRLQVSWKYDYRATSSADTRITRLGDEALQVSTGSRLRWWSIPAELRLR